MGRKPTKYIRTRKKLQWFYEQITILELQSMPLGLEISKGRQNKRGWSKVERRWEVAKIKTILKQLTSHQGMPYPGRPLRLTEKMVDHVKTEFTNEKNIFEREYENPKEKKHLQDIHRQSLNIALARIEAAFFHAGILEKLY